MTKKVLLAAVIDNNIGTDIDQQYPSLVNTLVNLFLYLVVETPCSSACIYPPPLSLLLQAPRTSGLRPMTKKDVPAVHRLLREYLSQFHLVPAMNQEEVAHWLLPQENIIDTYLVEVNSTK